MLVGHDPFISTEIDRLLGRQIAQHSFIDVDDLVLLEDHGSGEHCLIGKVHGVALDRHFPVSEWLRLHEPRDAVLNLGHLFMGLQACHSETIAHARASSDLFRHTIDTAELGSQVNQAISVLHHNEGLVQISDLLLVHILKVLSDADLLPIVVENLFHGVGSEVYILNDVGTHVTPVSDHRRADNLGVHTVVELCLVARFALQLLNFVEAGDGGYEAREGIHTDVKASFSHKDRGLEATDHH